jgi:hypothetical protein
VFVARAPTGVASVVAAACTLYAVLSLPFASLGILRSEWAPRCSGGRGGVWEVSNLSGFALAGRFTVRIVPVDTFKQPCLLLDPPLAVPASQLDVVKALCSGGGVDTVGSSSCEAASDDTFLRVLLPYAVSVNVSQDDKAKPEVRSHGWLDYFLGLTSCLVVAASRRSHAV